jgi:carboxyl-terminal processing protease
VDEPDAYYDNKTQKAIAKFQSENSLFPYGVADFTTQEKLNTLKEKLLLKNDLQYAKAIEILSKD